MTSRSPATGRSACSASAARFRSATTRTPRRRRRRSAPSTGRRYSIPGDYATVDADGTIQLLGRGSACINTGGEKVYPEEVELALRSHPDVFDCVVVGVPDDRWGEMVVALVEPTDGRTIDADALARALPASLAGYKVPKRFVVLDSLQRSPAGKADYKLLRELAAGTAVRREVAQ